MFTLTLLWDDRRIKKQCQLLPKTMKLIYVDNRKGDWKMHCSGKQLAQAPWALNGLSFVNPWVTGSKPSLVHCLV